MTLVILITAIAVSLSVSAVCSLMEATLLSLTPGNVGELKRRRPQAGAIWERFKADVDRPISVILICNTAAHTIGATVAGAEFEKYITEVYGAGAGGWSVFAFGLVFTLMMLQFTEILPKSLGVRYARYVAAITARPMDWVVRLMSPMVAAVKFLNRPFESRAEGGPAVNVEEITTLAAMARTGKVIDEQQERMISAAGRFGQVRARQVMTPRKDMFSLKLGEPFADALAKLRSTSYTRMPVVGENDDDVRGIVHLRDVFNALALVPGRFHVTDDGEESGEARAVLPDKPGGELHVIGTGELQLEKLLRPVPFIPETQPLGELLKYFQNGFDGPNGTHLESHIAIVVDEYGSTEGLITLEDVLEELVGDIEDEFDAGEHIWRLEPIDEEIPGQWRTDGQVPLREVADRLGLDVERIHIAEHGDVVTLGGYLTRELGRWPRAGDVVELADCEVHVIEVEQGQVREASLIQPAEVAAD